MEFKELYLQRHEVLFDYILEDIWEQMPEEKMRQRPHARVNSIAWILWHMSRVEDSGLNRFVIDGRQVLDEGGWMEKMNLPYRHNGGYMTSEDVDSLSRDVHLPALHAYSQAVARRTREILQEIEKVNLGELLQEEHVRKVIVDEGLAFKEQEEFIENYTSWPKGRCLMIYGLTHNFQHLGEIQTIASLLDVEFE